MENASLTAIAGITAGHVTDQLNLTGVTVVRFAGDGATAAVSVQGAAPGTRETDLLEPGNLVGKVHAIVLTGGSAYGLDAASGVMAALEAEGVGLPVSEDTVVPIVPAAVLFDLQVGSSRVRPSAQWGYDAAQDANDAPIPSGNVGAGTGATVGKLLGPSRATKGGLGSALMRLDNGVVVHAFLGGPVNNRQINVQLLAAGGQQPLGIPLVGIGFRRHMGFDHIMNNLGPHVGNNL